MPGNGLLSQGMPSIIQAFRKSHINVHVYAFDSKLGWAYCLSHSSLRILSQAMGQSQHSTPEGDRLALLLPFRLSEYSPAVLVLRLFDSTLPSRGRSQTSAASNLAGQVITLAQGESNG